MASGWARSLPRAVPPSGAAPKHVTLVYAYYENPQFLQRQADAWAAWPDVARAHLSVIVVDDGSPVPAVLPFPLSVPVRLFRIQVDVPWNWLAARNIGAHHADEGWLLLSDMDHVVPPETAEALVLDAHDPKAIYAFARREHTGEEVPPHSASFLLTRKVFWRTGGYDEALSGHYGTDGDFRRRARDVAQMRVLPQALVRHEYVADSSTSRYVRKLPADTQAVARLVDARGRDWRPRTLSFPYHEVRPC
jgi:glycosyl transferase family 2